MLVVYRLSGGEAALFGTLTEFPHQVGDNENGMKSKAFSTIGDISLTLSPIFFIYSATLFGLGFQLLSPVKLAGVLAVPRRPVFSDLGLEYFPVSLSTIGILSFVYFVL